LFINPKYKGQYFPPSASGGSNGGLISAGAKIGPRPEGEKAETHWPGPTPDPREAADNASKTLCLPPQAPVRLTGPPDPKTGLQYSREISLDSKSAEIRFHAIMKNIADHPIQWSMQSVTQYDTSDPQNAADYNREFWAFTPANSNSAYLARFHVRSGLADDPSFRVEKDLFSLHWLPLENEVWLDSTAGWLAVADSASGYGMLERFQHFAAGEYPGKATVIFYKNGGS